MNIMFYISFRPFFIISVAARLRSLRTDAPWTEEHSRLVDNKLKLKTENFIYIYIYIYIKLFS